jgi:tetratricopeptide (TPR) repeat protein
MTSKKRRSQPALLIISALVTLVGIPIHLIYTDNLTLAKLHYTEGHKAYRSVDCANAIKAFNEVSKVWKLPGNDSYVTSAEQEKAECVDYKAADDLQKSGDLQSAVISYGNFLKQYEDSFLVNAVKNRLASLFKTAQPSEVIGLDFCNSIDGIARKKTILESDLPKIYAACGQQYEASQKYIQASRVYEDFLKDYPEHPLLPQIKAGLANSMIERTKSEGGEAPPLEATGKTSDGVTTVKITNNSPEKIRIYYRGADTGFVELEPCKDCPVYTTEQKQCPDDLGTVGEYTFKPGQYDIVMKTISDPRVMSLKDKWQLNDGWAYSNCYYLIRSPF